MKLLTALMIRARPLRRMSTPTRYLITTAMIIGLFALRVWADAYLAGYPFLLFLPGIFAAAVVFNHGSGFFAASLSTALSWYFFVEPEGSFQIAYTRDAVATVLFLVIGILMAASIEALRQTAESLADSNRRLDVTDRQKKALLDDINHRIKNSLQLLVAMIGMQRRTVRDEAARQVLDSVVSRMTVLAQVYDRLHVQGTASTVNLHPFVTGLCADLEASLIGLRPVALRAEATDVEVGLGRAVFVGLIINELVTNALKYAFPQDRVGTVHVRLKALRQHLSLEIADDGIGSPPERVESIGTGRRLVRSLAQQLGGTYLEEGPPGTTVRIDFPRNEPA